MAWTTPKTNWETGELVTAEDMNAVGENLAALENRRSVVASYTTTEGIRLLGGALLDVDSDNLILTITTTGGDVLVHFYASVSEAGGGSNCSFDVEVDGQRRGGDVGLVRFGSRSQVISFTHLIQGLSAGPHTFKLQWKGTAGGRGTYVGAGAQFWVREI